MVFVLDKDSRADDFVECWIVDERRPRQVARDSMFGAKDVGEILAGSLGFTSNPVLAGAR